MKKILLLAIVALFFVACSATLKETKKYDPTGKIVVSSTLELKDYTVTETAAGKRSYVPKSGLTTDTFTNLLKTMLPLQ